MAGCCCYPYRWRDFAGAGLVLLVGRSGGYPIRFGPCRRGDPLPIGAAVVLIGGVVLVHRADGGVLAGLAVGGGGAALSYMVAMVCPGAAVGGGAPLPERVLFCRWCRAAMPPGVHRGGSTVPPGTVPGATVPAGAVPGRAALS